MTNLGRKIRDLRIAKGLTLPELADKAEISKGYLWRIEESGEKGDGTRPSGKTLTKLADALGLSADQLLGTEVVLGYVGEMRIMSELPESLVEYIKVRERMSGPLTEEQIWMLAGISYEGKVPARAQDWDYILQSIIRTIR